MISLCELCETEQDLEDLRPYGPKCEMICFSCGMKDEETTSRMFHMQLDATRLPVIGIRVGPYPLKHHKETKQ